jgi:serine O-acetyltransferase
MMPHRLDDRRGDVAHSQRAGSAPVDMTVRHENAAGGARRSRLAGLLRAAIADLDVIVARDPSVRSRGEALLHPALPAVWSYRLAHALHVRGRRCLARAISTLARMVTAVEIHPGACIGRGFFIDHGCGVVIGETAVIGDDVTLFHQVTLGAVGWWHDRRRPEGAARHPRLGAGVVVGTNATLLGPITIGSAAVIGAQALVLNDVPPGARVLAPTASVRPPAGMAQPRHPTLSRVGGES